MDSQSIEYESKRVIVKSISTEIKQITLTQMVTPSPIITAPDHQVARIIKNDSKPISYGVPYTDYSSSSQTEKN